MATKGSETNGVLLFISAYMQKLNVHAEVMPAIGDIHGGKINHTE